MTCRDAPMPLVPWLGILTLIVACSREQSRSAYTTSVVDGIPVRTYTTEATVPVDPYSVVTDVVFGTDQSEDTYFFRYVSPFAVLPDGGLLVHSGVLHRFAWDGAHLGTIGKSGIGPGEYSSGASRILEEDRLLVFDARTRRRSIFDLDGTLLDTTPFPESWAGAGAILPNALAGPASDRITLGMQRRRSEMTNTFFLKIEARGPDMEFRGMVIDTSFAYPVTTIEEDNIWPPMTIGFTACALASDLPVAWSMGETFRIEFVEPVEGSHWATVIPHRAIPVTQAHREAYLKDGFERSGRVEAARRALTFPGTFPHLEGVLWDSEGRLWVLEYRDPAVPEAPYRYFVFDRKGGWLFTQVLPGRAGLIADGRVFVASELETGDPVVRSYRLRGNISSR